MPPAGFRLVLLFGWCLHYARLSLAIGIQGPLPHMPYDIPVPLTTTTTIGVDGFIDDEALLTCLDNLLFADANLDLDLESEEYADFIALESNGQLSVSFAELDAEFVAIFYAEACSTCFDQTGEEDCCEGDNAHIDLEGSDPDRFYSTVVYICDNVNEQLSIKFPDSPTVAPPPDETASPTRPEDSVPPTLAPVTGSPTNSPSNEPTLAPVVTEAPTSSTDEPSSASVITESPTSSTTEPSVAPSPGPTTASPTSLPSLTPSTASPSAQPSTVSPTAQVHPTSSPSITPQPSTSLPTVSPSFAPSTAVPSASPTSAPSEGPTTSPSTLNPTQQPSSSPSTESPSMAPTTSEPSLEPTQAPSTSQPTSSPSVSPTINPDLLCVFFSYQLNDIGGGLSAEDILTENGNTLKTGLEIAGRTITIQILNETFPNGNVPVPNPESLDTSSVQSSIPAEDDTSNNLRQHHKMQRRHSQSGQQHRSHPHERSLKGFHHAMERGVTSRCDTEQSHVILKSLVDIWQPRIPSQEDLERRKLFVNRIRRLVFYTDEYPSEVRNVVDFICPPESPSDVSCVIVEQKACVVLEEGDDPEVVNLALVNGLRAAISSGAFEAAIPPEHIP